MLFDQAGLMLFLQLSGSLFYRLGIAKLEDQPLGTKTLAFLSQDFGLLLSSHLD
jgi:hypothetical protein